MFMKALTDDETQKRGVVLICYCHHPSEEDLSVKVNPLYKGLPHRVVGAHFCFEDQSLVPFVSALRLTLPPRIRARLRAHLGT